MTESILEPALLRASLPRIVPIGRAPTAWLPKTYDVAPARMTMSPPPAETPTMPPPRAVAMRAKRATPPTPVPTAGPLRMTMSLDARWTA